MYTNYGTQNCIEEDKKRMKFFKENECLIAVQCATTWDKVSTWDNLGSMDVDTSIGIT